MKKFSSPTGELSFYHHHNNLYLDMLDSVFVPYRGTKFLSKIRIAFGNEDTIVFVPYRGTKFLSKIRIAFGNEDTIVFVPYRGTKFLSIICRNTMKKFW